MASFKLDGSFTTAASHGNFRRSFPIPRDTTAQIIEQEFQILSGSFSALALSTAHPTVTSAYLVEEGPQIDIDGGMVQWTRRYATIPANRDEFESFSYTFPGLWSNDGNPPYNQYWVSGADGGRDPFPDKVVSRLRYEYFHCKTGETYETPDEIPVLQGLEISLTTNADARMDYLLPEGEFLADTVPSREEWETLAAGGTGIGTGSNAGEFIAEDSTIEHYMGNIWCRITRYVKAK